MRKKLILSFSCLALISGAGFAQNQGATSKPTTSAAASTVQLSNFNDTISYALGLSLAKFYKEQGASSINTKLLSQAVDAVFTKDSVLFSDQEIATLLMAADKRFSEQKAAGAKKQGAEFLAKNKTREGVVELASGMQYEVLTKGDGPMPTDTNNVKVNYIGTLLDGTEFDNSYKRGEPIDLGVTQVIKGWTEALKLMHVGDKWKLYIPSDLAYGDRGAGGTIPPGATLIFEIELLAINH